MRFVNSKDTAVGFDNTRFASALFLALVLCLAAPARSAGVVSDELMVSGAVKNKLTLKVDDLKAFAPDQIVSVTVMRRVESMRQEGAAASKSDASRNADASKEVEVPSIARGVRLTAILERAGLANTDPNDWKHTVVLATATDNYRVVFSWPELFNSDLGASVLVVFERDGQPLADREGHIALVSAKDQRTGPRSVRWLRQLDIKVLRE
jgi:DMSO/TMAO reductase YedYZ molybdopterin-dependent catalytic subunit